MNYRIWYSTESFADYIIDKTDLRNKKVAKHKMYESDANNVQHFHTMPDHIKQILYLDAPDIIVEHDSEPIFSVEVSTEAGTGHNAFQRFARLAASVENNVPAFYIYPEAAIINRKDCASRWDKINPLIFKALDDVMNIYKIPALLYYFPTDYKTTATDATSSKYVSNKGLIFESNYKYAGSPSSVDDEMSQMFSAMNEIVRQVEKRGVIKGRENLLANKVISSRRSYMNSEYIAKGGTLALSPLSATVKIDSQLLIQYLDSKYGSIDYKVGELLRSRPETIVYQVDAKFRGDPYPGALAAIDYLCCREGKSFEERRYNLVLCWGHIDVSSKTLKIIGTKSSIDDFVNQVQASEKRNLLGNNYSDIPANQISRYYMQVRYGSMFSKVKHIRVFSYFADAILFNDGALWRDA